jgi:cellulose biosynthesis protein BcsQ
MRVITIASQKGGSGKTTLALHLAAEAERSGETAVIVDLDPGSLVAEAIQAIAAYDVPVAPVHLGQRAAFVHALTAGQVAQEYEPGGKAAEEVSRLYMWIRIYYHM